MLIVKMMSSEDTPDTDTRKSYRLFTGVVDVDFSRGEGGEAYMDLMFSGEDDKETYEVIGNVFVMNEAGKTVASFGSAPLIFADGMPT